MRVEIVTDTENFVWTGQEELTVRSGNRKFFPGYAPKALLQISPPASVTALSAKTQWGL